MNVNEIDKFRNDFFEKVIQAEREKEKERKLEQKNCFHNYSIMGAISINGYQHRTCSKCDHSAVKSLRIWSAEKAGSCIIS